MDRAALTSVLHGFALLALVACHTTSSDDERDAERDPASGADAADDGDGGRSTSSDASTASDGGSGRARDDGITDSATGGPHDSSVDAAQDGGGDAARDGGLDAEAGVAIGAGSDSAAQDAGWEAAALPNLTGVDLSLGGLNADLTPIGNCLGADETVPACIDILGEFDGQRFDHCDPFSLTAGNGLGTQGFSCHLPLPSGEDLELWVRLDDALIGKLPSHFSFSAPPDNAHAGNDIDVSAYYDGGGSFSTSQASDDGQLTKEVRISGVAGLAPGVLKDTLSQLVRGSFALTTTPTSTCNPASRSCHRVRLRGSFTARTVFDY